MTPEIEKQVGEIRDDCTHGAGWLARRAVLVLGRAISSLGGPAPQLEEQVRELVRRLIMAKPTMAPVANLVCRLGYEVLERARAGDDVTAIRQKAERLAGEIAAEAEEAVHQAAGRAHTVVGTGSTVITCSYSSAVVETLLRAGRSDSSLQVRAARSWDGGAAHGERLATQLSARGVACEVIPDSTVEVAASQATLALIGADAVLPDATVVNGRPSLALAEAARKAGIPLYCVCETSKFDARALLGWQLVVEPGFELIPASLVAGFCTERGALDRHQVVALVPIFQTCLAPFL